MHLHTAIGSPVLFTGQNGDGSENIIAQTYLIPGTIYTIAEINIPRRWVRLEEWPTQWWNIAMFLHTTPDPDQSDNSLDPDDGIGSGV